MEYLSYRLREYINGSFKFRRLGRDAISDQEKGDLQSPNPYCYNLDHFFCLLSSSTHTLKTSNPSSPKDTQRQPQVCSTHSLIHPIISPISTLTRQKCPAPSILKVLFSPALTFASPRFVALFANGVWFAVTWAQRSSETDQEKNIVYLSVNATDLQHPKVELTADGVTVEGVQRETNNVYKVALEFYEPIDQEVLQTLVPLANSLFSTSPNCSGTAI